MRLRGGRGIQRGLFRKGAGVPGTGRKVARTLIWRFPLKSAAHGARRPESRPGGPPRPPQKVGKGKPQASSRPRNFAASADAARDSARRARQRPAPGSMREGGAGGPSLTSRLHLDAVRASTSPLKDAQQVAVAARAQGAEPEGGVGLEPPRRRSRTAEEVRAGDGHRRGAADDPELRPPPPKSIAGTTRRRTSSAGCRQESIGSLPPRG